MNSNVLLLKISLFLARLLGAYSLLIWVRIILSWIFPNPSRTNWIYWIGRLTDPFLKAFKSKRSTIGRLDFSPIFAIGTVAVAESILQYFGTTGTLTFAMVAALFLSAFWTYGLSIFFWVLFFALIFKTIASISRNPAMWNASSSMDEASRPVTEFVRSFAKGRILSERAVSLISLLLVIAVWFMSRYLVNWLIGMTMRIPF